MGKSKHKKKRDGHPKQKALVRNWGPSDVIVPLVALVGGVAIGVGVWYVSTRPGPSEPIVAEINPYGSGQRGEQSTSEPLESSPDLPKLKGKWIRADGGYVLDIKSVAADGKIDAAYLNPRPIRIAKAQASREGEAIKVFIELRDVNYPGSTYKLTYDRNKDQLSGIYFQATHGQRFDVNFSRVK